MTIGWYFFPEKDENVNRRGKVLECNYIKP
jgi:hypothetical protein